MLRLHKLLQAVLHGQWESMEILAPKAEQRAAGVISPNQIA